MRMHVNTSLYIMRVYIIQNSFLCLLDCSVRRLLSFDRVVQDGDSISCFTATEINSFTTTYALIIQPVELYC